ncbi:MAG TPA: lysoplasmalogenase [Holophagaceae bacterium]|nr:lysoplasmalogenase [Holophagaceae bacterium]
MKPLLGVACVLSAVLALHAVRNGGRPRRFFAFKPLTTLLILGLAALAPASTARAWMLAGLGLSLVGDVCLLFHGNRAFLGGLGSFLIAHLAFIAAFCGGVAAGPPPRWTLLLVPYALVLGGVLWRRTGALRGPVLIYALVLLGMALAAARAQAVLGTPAAAWGLAGALTFVVSDSLLAVDRFVHPHPRAQVGILATYWAALAGLVASLPGV